MKAGPHPSWGLRSAISFLAAGSLLSACAERPVVVPEIAALPGGLAQRIQCAADLKTGKVQCASATPDANLTITLGGQGSYIDLTAENATYAGGVFAADFRVRNLTGQPLGTSDGNSTIGLKAFIASGPTVTSGSGIVSVGNADGVGAFTAANQPYFFYNEILHVFSGQTSAKAWHFNAPATVNTFTFTVLVQTVTPREVGVLRWSVERGRSVLGTAIWAADEDNVFTCANSVCYRSGPSESWLPMSGPLADSAGRTASVLGLHGTSPTDIWAVGGGGLIAHYDGTKWRSSATPTSAQLNSVAAISPTDVYAVGIGSNFIYHYDGASWAAVHDMGAFGVIVRALASDNVWVSAFNGLRHWDGASWTTIPAPAGVALRGLWAVSATEVWTGSTNGQLYRYDGTTLSQVASPTAEAIWGFIGFAPNDIYAATGGSTILHYDGATWSLVGSLPTMQVSMLAGTSPTNLFLAGYNGVDQVYHFDGTAWRGYGAPMAHLTDIWGNSANNVYAVGSAGTILHYDGATWRPEPSGSAGQFLGVWGNATDVWAVGNHGTSAFRRTNGVWSASSRQTARIMRGVWGSSSFVWAVGDSGTIERFDGTTWGVQPSGVLTSLYAVHGTSGTDVWAVGAQGTILRYDGTTWSLASAGATTTSMTLTDVIAFASNNVWASGFGLNGARVLLRWNGTSWTEQFGIPGPGAISCFSAIAPNDMWVGGGTGVVFHWNGETWTPFATGTAASVCPQAVHSQLLFAAGSGGIILRAGR